jgi:hypothetical protein
MSARSMTTRTFVATVGPEFPTTRCPPSSDLTMLALPRILGSHYTLKCEEPNRSAAHSRRATTQECSSGNFSIFPFAAGFTALLCHGSR